VATTAHQQYVGRVAATSPVWTAVRETRGQVLLWEGELFPAFYHTDSGGHTEDPRVVFAATNMPALRGVRVDFPSDSPTISGISTCRSPTSRARSSARASGWGASPGSRCSSGARPSASPASRSWGQAGRVALRGNDFRRIIGYDTLKSTLFAVAVDETTARFAGRGYGHGVGMDQAGAKTMGQLGYSARQILEYYYPGAEFASLP
jgi:stage II sporulation protein D